MFKRKIYEEYRKLGMPQNEISAEFSMILDSLNITNLKEITDDFSKNEQKKIEEIVKERVKTKRPLQHILGFGYFMGERFFVNEKTLIPRPETEILVNECLKYVNEKSRILDIGTGSGCIAIELKKKTSAFVDAIDISNDALHIAKKNSKTHNVFINFFQSDLFSNVEGKYDLIVSNPPYIPISQKDNLEEIVKNFDPHIALFADDELGIDFYKRIINKSATFLNENGFIAFELGLGQIGPITEIFTNNNFKIKRISEDLNGIKRVIIAKKN